MNEWDEVQGFGGHEHPDPSLTMTVAHQCIGLGRGHHSERVDGQVVVYATKGAYGVVFDALTFNRPIVHGSEDGAVVGMSIGDLIWMINQQLGNPQTWR